MVATHECSSTKILAIICNYSFNSGKQGYKNWCLCMHLQVRPSTSAFLCIVYVQGMRKSLTLFQKCTALICILLRYHTVWCVWKYTLFEIHAGAINNWFHYYTSIKVQHVSLCVRKACNCVHISDTQRTEPSYIDLPCLGQHCVSVWWWPP